MNYMNGKYVTEEEYNEMLEKTFINNDKDFISYKNKSEIGKIEVFDNYGNLKEEMPFIIYNKSNNELEDLKKQVKELLKEREELKNENIALHNRIDHFTMQLNDKKLRIKGML